MKLKTPKGVFQLFYSKKLGEKAVFERLEYSCEYGDDLSIFSVCNDFFIAIEYAEKLLHLEGVPADDIPAYMDMLFHRIDFQVPAIPRHDPDVQAAQAPYKLEPAQVTDTVIEALPTREQFEATQQPQPQPAEIALGQLDIDQISQTLKKIHAETQARDNREIFDQTLEYTETSRNNLGEALANLVVQSAYHFYNIGNEVDRATAENLYDTAQAYLRYTKPF